MEYLDPHQIARLECLKLAMAVRDIDPRDRLALAHEMAAFVTDGTRPDTQQERAA